MGEYSGGRNPEAAIGGQRTVLNVVFAFMAYWNG